MRDRLAISPDSTLQTIAEQVGEMHSCMDTRFDTIEENLRVDRETSSRQFRMMENRIESNMRSALNTFVTRAELSDKLDDVAQKQQTVQKALGVSANAKLSEVRAHPFFNMKAWQIFATLGGSVMAFQMLVRAVVSVWPSALHFLLG